MKRFLVVTLTLFAVVIAVGQAQDTKVISGATVIDGTGRAAIKDAVIVITGTRISQVGPRERTKVPQGAQVIDARGKFIIPGLADMHNHLGDGTFGPSQVPYDFQKNLARVMAWGITLIFAPEIYDMKAFAELKRVSAGETAPYPHFFGVGHWFQAKGSPSWEKGYAPETPEEARAAVRELKAANVDGVKLVYSDYTYAFKGGKPKLKPEVMAAIIGEAHQQGLKAYVHAPILKYAKEVLRAGADGLMHGILSDPVDEEFIRLMKKNGAVYIATHAIFEAVGDISGWARREAAFDERGLIAKEVFEAGMNPKFVKQFETDVDNFAYTKEHLPILRANTRKVWDAGLLVVTGSDTSDSGTGVLLGLSSQLELLLLVEAGLKPREVIQAATINAALMIGREKDLGTVEPGKLADLVILEADPLLDIRNVRRVHRVVKGGVAYDPELLHVAK